jgi:hypothetical protein
MSTAGPPPAHNPPPPPSPQPSVLGSGPDYHLEAYKLLADMYVQEDTTFWTRNQTFLLLNSGLVAILVGILGLQSKPAPLPTSAVPATSQSVLSPPAGALSHVTTQQIVSPPTAPQPESGMTALRFPLVSICVLGFLLCFVWVLLIKRAEGLNDHLAIHMIYLEQKHLMQINNMKMLDKLFTTALKADRRWPKFWRDTMEVDDLRVVAANDKMETPRLPRFGSFVRVYDGWVGIAFLFVGLWALLAAWIVLS